MDRKSPAKAIESGSQAVTRRPQMSPQSSPSKKSRKSAGKEYLWSDAKRAVSEARAQCVALFDVSVNTVQLRLLSADQQNYRIFFLFSVSSIGKSELKYIDVSLAQTFTYENRKHSKVLKPHDLLTYESEMSIKKSHDLSLEEKLLSQRKRILNVGVLNYIASDDTIDPTIFIPKSNGIFSYSYDKSNTSYKNTGTFADRLEGAKINFVLNPFNGKVAAFVNYDNVYVLTCSNNLFVPVTTTMDLSNRHIINGTPSYVIQEEFNRYDGFWWQPLTYDNRYRLLCEETDETDVSILSLVTFDNKYSGQELYRYPRVGKTNPSSKLKLIEFRIINETIYDIKTFPLNHQVLLEYLVNAGWSTAGEFPWALTLDRDQKKIRLIGYFPVLGALGCDDDDDDGDGGGDGNDDDMTGNKENIIGAGAMETDKGSDSFKALVLYEEVSPFWINATKSVRFLKCKRFIRGSDTVQFIWSSEESGFNHLYLITVRVHIDEERSEVVEKVALTSGDWVVKPTTNVWFDESNEQLYFLAGRESPLTFNLYTLPVSEPDRIQMLTDAAYTHEIYMSKDFKLFMDLRKNIRTQYEFLVYKIDKSDESDKQLVQVSVAARMEPQLDSILGDDRPRLTTKMFEKFVPEMHTYRSRDGITFNAMVFKPHNFDRNRRYPTVLYVYGGPCVQLVRNTFYGFRYAKTHLLAANGFCVVMVDSRGSTNRGFDFESHIHQKFGLVELDDQLEVLNHLNEKLKAFDMTRLAIMGWSYGGYLSLMGLAHYGNVFKVAVVGAPVTDWLMYDTAYTERYLGQLPDNESVYENSSVLKHVDKLPDEENRLLIIHGQMDENVHFYHTSLLVQKLAAANKPYQLKIYPEERHSFRNLYSSINYEVNVLHFLKNYL